MVAWYGLDLHLTAVKYVKRDDSGMFKYQNRSKNSQHTNRRINALGRNFGYAHA